MELRTKHKFRLDPRTKLLLILMGNILLFSYGEAIYLHIATTLALLLVILHGKVKMALQMGAFYVALYAITYLISFAPKEINSIWGLIVLPIIIFMPIFALAFLLFATTEISEMVTALQRMKLPSLITTPLIVMFRFFPTLRREIRAISDAMKLKGVKKNPLKILEYVYVPILFNAVKLSDELHISALTRGLGINKTSTETIKLKLNIYDLLVIVIMAVLILLRKEVITLW